MAKAGSGRTRRDRGSISAEEILEGALRVAQEVSIENLSMPQLAKHLGVGVTSIYWYFRRKDDLLDAMTDRALERFEFTVPTISAANWRESLRDHALTMRKRFRADPILCDLVLIRGQYGHRAMHGALQKLGQPIGALVEAGLTVDQAADTYGAISVHIRGSVVLERLQERTEGFPAQRDDGGRYIGFADDTDFGFILDSILEHAEAIIAAA
ncbi:TetR family transcriptional regulator [Mycobacterium sp. 1164985.4]|uniref:TetR/AcrR family transcriptional regulator n=1 Tax=Mycobacterium sp. 1164985.4 TaxID=1834069 RepID=UPI0007FD05CD|nr:TetR family transcriptional regulator [Mycobacterium sp. 1164985.4]OBK80406.1 TetR family transcriptional regulator [Mycobacterium sp. 1164985.4]